MQLKGDSESEECQFLNAGETIKEYLIYLSDKLVLKSHARISKMCQLLFENKLFIRDCLLGIYK